MAGRDDSLRELAIVAAFVVNETSVNALRVRLIMPWLDQASRWHVSWRERIDALRPIFPEMGGSIDEELTRIRRVVGQARARPNKTAIDLPAEHRRIAAAAGVSLPGYSEDDAPSPGVVINYLLRTLENLSVSAAGGRSVAIPSRAVAGDRRAPTALSAPSITGTNVEPSPAKAGEGGTVSEKRFPLVFTPGPSAARTSAPSLLDLANRASEPKAAATSTQFVPETEEERIERESADRRARLEAKKKTLVVTLPGGPAGSEGEK